MEQKEESNKESNDGKGSALTHGRKERKERAEGNSEGRKKEIKRGERRGESERKMYRN